MDEVVTGADLDALHVEYHRTRDARTREQLIRAYQPFARHFALRYRNSSEPLDDLIQAAYVGLVASVDRYDPARDVKFSTYASRVITGELKRHFRDRTWRVHVPRSLQERALVVRHTADVLQHAHGRSPTVAEIAEELGLGEDDVLEAMDVNAAYRPRSLDACVDDQGSRRPLDIAAAEPGFDRVETTLTQRRTVDILLAKLDPADREIVVLYYGEGLSQGEVGARTGYSQVTVSRRIRRAVERLRVCAATL